MTEILFKDVSDILKQYQNPYNIEIPNDKELVLIIEYGMKDTSFLPKIEYISIPLIIYSSETTSRLAFHFILNEVLRIWVSPSRYFDAEREKYLYPPDSSILYFSEYFNHQLKTILI